MKILLLSNGFKGTLTAKEANTAIEEGLRAELSELEVRSFPMADGGQGSSEIASQISGAERQEVEIFGPDAKPVIASYWLHRLEAFIEIAEGSGLVKSDLNRALHTKTSYGTGQLIAHALKSGAESVSVFFGGSGTNDAGVGLAKALGVEFFTFDGQTLPSPEQYYEIGSQAGAYPGEQLAKIADFSTEKYIRKKSTTLLGVVDVDNPVSGPSGASLVYGLQKGGEPDELQALDRSLAQLEELGLKKSQKDNVPGLGAAGAAAFGLYAFCGGLIVSGPKYFLDLIHFDQHLAWADLIITGEGKLDEQSIHGKLSAEILRRANEVDKPVVAFAGIVEPRTLKAPGLYSFSCEEVEPQKSHFETLSLLAKSVSGKLAEIK